MKLMRYLWIALVVIPLMTPRAYAYSEPIYLVPQSFLVQRTEKGLEIKVDILDELFSGKLMLTVTPEGNLLLWGHEDSCAHGIFRPSPEVAGTEINLVVTDMNSELGRPLFRYLLSLKSQGVLKSKFLMETANARARLEIQGTSVYYEGSLKLHLSNDGRLLPGHLSNGK